MYIKLKNVLATSVGVSDLTPLHEAPQPLPLLQYGGLYWPMLRKVTVFFFWFCQKATFI